MAGADEGQAVSVPALFFYRRGGRCYLDGKMHRAFQGVKQILSGTPWGCVPIPGNGPHPEGVIAG